jgi:hypothetical protein
MEIAFYFTKILRNLPGVTTLYGELQTAYSVFRKPCPCHFSKKKIWVIPAESGTAWFTATSAKT